MSSDMTTQPTAPTNVVWHHATVTRARREAQNGHHGAIIWFTGLSGSGKSTLAHAGEIAEFTGISSPYQVPENPELTVNTGTASLDACVQQVIGEITNRGICTLQHDPILESESKKYCQGSGGRP